MMLLPHGKWLAASVVLAGMTLTTWAADPPPAKVEPLDFVNRVHVQFTEEAQRFGIVYPRLRDPRNAGKPKLLTRAERGITNNTCVRIDHVEGLFGRELPGHRWVKEDGSLLKEIPIPGKDKERSRMAVWEAEAAKVRFTHRWRPSSASKRGFLTRYWSNTALRIATPSRTRLVCTS